MNKIAILQDSIPSYRIPLYDLLGETHDITIIHGGKSESNKNVAFKEIALNECKYWKFHFLNGLRNEIKEGNFEVVIIMFDLHWPQFMRLLFQRKFKTILWGYRTSLSKNAQKIRAWLSLKGNSQIIYGDDEVVNLLDIGVKRDNIFVADNTIFVSNHRQTYSESSKSLLFVGRAQVRKKVDLLLRAFKQNLPNIPRDIIIEIVGVGDENENLKNLASKLGISDRVHFLGSLRDDEKLIKVFERAMVYVSPGPVGLGVLHSMAYGVPVITLEEGRHGPEFNNIIDGQNGYICDGYDDLVEKLKLIINDKERSKLFSVNSYQHYKENRTMNNMVRQFSKAIDNLV